jgi:hypothetical protein
MRCSSSFDQGSCSETTGYGEARLFSSVLSLGALFGLMTSPCARGSFVSAFVVFGIPFFTFVLAAPGRVSLGAEFGLMGRDLQAGILATLMTLSGRRRDARLVIETHRADVERTYGAQERLRALVDADPLRLHHARRIGLLASLLATGAGVLLPITMSSTYTWGEGLEVPAVILLDVIAIGLPARMVAERIALRLFEASSALAGGGVWAARLRTVPLLTLLGGTLGGLGALVILLSASLASGLETYALTLGSFGAATSWFLRETAPLSWMLGVGLGAIMGMGCGLAQVRRP